jgi:hypothetical protein
MRKVSDALLRFVWSESDEAAAEAQEDWKAERASGVRSFTPSMTIRQQREAGMPPPSQRGAQSTQQPDESDSDRDRLERLEEKVNAIADDWSGTAWEDAPNEVEQEAAFEAAPAPVAPRYDHANMTPAARAAAELVEGAARLVQK